MKKYHANYNIHFDDMHCRSNKLVCTRNILLSKMSEIRQGIDANVIFMELSIIT